MNCAHNYIIKYGIVDIMWNFPLILQIYINNKKIVGVRKNVQFNLNFGDQNNFSLRKRFENIFKKF